MKKISYLLLFLLLLLSCEQEVAWDLNGNNDRLLVVDAIITDQNKPHEIMLSYSNTLLNSTTTIVNNATVNIRINTDSVIHTTYTDSGRYVSERAFIASVENVYQLEVIIETDTFTATDVMEPVGALPPVKPEIDVESGWYRLPEIQETTPSKVLYYIDWSNTGYTGKTNALEIQYSLFSFDINEQFKPPAQQIYFPPGSRIIRKKLSLSKAHQSYLRSLLIETEWRGGIFDVAHGVINTNLSEGATGFFGISAVLTDTIQVD